MAGTDCMREFIRRHRVETLLFFAFLASYSYFFHVVPGWNVNTRIALTFAVVDTGHFWIDSYHRNPLTETFDKAYYRGHYYCDKSPALSFLAVPFYAALKPLMGFSDSETKVAFARQWCTIWTVGLMAALGGAFFFRLMLQFGAQPLEALALTMFLAYGTNIGGYSSLFMPYWPATTCLLGAYLLLLGPRVQGREFGRRRAAMIGLLASAAGYFEFTFGMAGAVFLLLALATMKPRRRFAWAVLGATLPVIALFAYNYSIFGEMTIAYRHEVIKAFREGMKEGAMGVSAPRLNILYFITIHPYKGLFFYSPVLLFFFLGSLWTRRLGRFGPDLAAAWAIVLGYLAFNSGYYLWWGGWSMGPRHLIAMLPFMFMPILAAMRRHPNVRGLVMFAGCVSILLNFPVIALDPQIQSVYPDAILANPPITMNLRSPWLTQWIPAFLQGNVAVNPFQKLLPGLWSLAPLVALWGAVLFTAMRYCREDTRQRESWRGSAGS